MKPTSLFSAGMRPAVFSSYENTYMGEGWKRDGLDVSYSKNNIIRVIYLIILALTSIL